MNSPYVNGYDAYWDDETYSDNPHEKGTDDYKEWRQGFFDAFEDDCE